jgi:hypothetical protein
MHSHPFYFEQQLLTAVSFSKAGHYQANPRFVKKTVCVKIRRIEKESFHATELSEKI